MSRYTFISSLSVYADNSQPGLDESGPVGTISDTATEEVTNESYGPLKVLCEQAVETALPGRALILRPGFIVGPYDSSDRFPYWPHRIVQGGDVLAPGNPVQPVQIIDGRDLAEWTVRLLEQGATGTYNATGPDYVLTLGEILDTCKTVGGSNARFIWASDKFLKENEADSFTLLPFYIPDSPETRGFMATSIAKAVAAGLSFRPLAETVRATLAWDATRSADAPRKVGLTRERERELLAKLSEKNPENFTTP